MSARQTDLNGFIEVKGNPISKVGVFPYLGAQLGKTGADVLKLAAADQEGQQVQRPRPAGAESVFKHIVGDAVIIQQTLHALRTAEQVLRCALL